MKRIIFFVTLITLLINPVFNLWAQSSTSTQTPSNVFATEEFPQWAKDFRRFDIIAFGVFPFSMFAVTFFTDMIRWNDANGLDFSEEGRRYAPWPMKSAGAVEMTNEEHERTVMLAIGLSLSIALIDLVIFKVKQSKERRKTEGRPAGSFEIERRPLRLIIEEEPPEIIEETVEAVGEMKDDTIGIEQ
ncbi:MAG: hypothetical protein LBU66_02725 [Treponema sp.]|jgi:hypothetical protein|nr:hypothetical protein [Treponema sp.]